mmetsp:Transcript_139192/g.444816  ORF Transcript_139192/g.444816 Transcript_139192/m.444816 type:complete len:262 (-) Transcript_139192:375-1160(-)
MTAAPFFLAARPAILPIAVTGPAIVRCRSDSRRAPCTKFIAAPSLLVWRPTTLPIVGAGTALIHRRGRGLAQLPLVPAAPILSCVGPAVNPVLRIGVTPVRRRGGRHRQRRRRRAADAPALAAPQALLQRPRVGVQARGFGHARAELRGAQHLVAVDVRGAHRDEDVGAEVAEALGLPELAAGDGAVLIAVRAAPGRVHHAGRDLGEAAVALRRQGDRAQGRRGRGGALWVQHIDAADDEQSQEAEEANAGRSQPVPVIDG